MNIYRKNIKNFSRKAINGIFRTFYNWMGILFMIKGIQMIDINLGLSILGLLGGLCFLGISEEDYSKLFF